MKRQYSDEHAAAGVRAPLPEIEKHIRRRLEAIDFERLANEAVTRALDKARGRI